MTSIVELFPKSRKLAYDSRQLLSQVQNGTLPPSELFLSLEELSRQLDIMEDILQKETPAQREMWNIKIKELREDSTSIQRQGEYYNRMASANYRHQRERDEVLAIRRRRKNQANGGMDGGGDYHAVAMGDLAEESDSWAQSHTMVSDLIGSGQASLSALVEQRQRLKGVKRFILDIGNKLGLSNSLMRIVERRDVTDAYLVFGGMVITLIVLYLCWFW